MSGWTEVNTKRKLCDNFKKNESAKDGCSHHKCGERASDRILRNRPPGIYSIGRAGAGEVSAVSEIKGWEKVRVQIDSGAIDTVGPRGVAKAFAMS